MARTIQEIFGAIEAEKNASPDLLYLNSPSQTAIWRVWAYVIASCIWAHEKLWDIFWQEIQEKMKRNVPGTLAWYRDKALEFQYNALTAYYIVFNEDNAPIYDTFAPNHRIIAYAATIESFNSVVMVKVAKDNNGIPEQLNAAELQSFKDYMLSVKFAGTRLKCISLPADQLTINATIYFDPIAPLNVVSDAVKSAINAYLNALPFNGLVYLEQIQDAIQQVKGVISVEMGVCQVSYQGGAPITINRFLQTLAGYVVVHPSTPLSNTLTFVPSNL